MPSLREKRRHRDPATPRRDVSPTTPCRRAASVIGIVGSKAIGARRGDEMDAGAFGRKSCGVRLRVVGTGSRPGDERAGETSPPRR